MIENTIQSRIKTAAFAFRGYNVTNLGRSPELLEHPAYGPMVEAVLREASQICADSIKQNVDLVQRLRRREESTLASFPEDVALIVGMELAQLELLEKFFGVSIRDASLSIGYSIGELTALILGGVFTLGEVLPIPLAMAPDCAALATDVTMGVLFTRGEAINLENVRRLCIQLSSQGRGIIAPSSQIAPNTILLLAEGEMLDAFQREIPNLMEDRLMLRRNKNRWPPLHTPIIWKRNVPTRTALAFYSISGGFRAPTPPVVSCVTGTKSYNDYNSRELLARWTDHPQLLWDALYEMLADGVDLLIHVGPEPNMIPATFERLSSNVNNHLGGKFFRALGTSMGSRLTRQVWLTNMLSSKAALLRSPFLEHIVLEDWLLAQNVG